MLKEPPGGLTPEQVAALPDAAFTPVDGMVNLGYTRDSYWFRVEMPREPAGAPGDAGRLWLELMPPYLDRVTLHQRDATGWHVVASGDTAPMAQRIPVRQLLFPLLPGQPLLLHVQTSSPLQFEGTVRRSAALLPHLTRTEWASGLHQGVSLALTLLLAGAALVLRMRPLAAMATAAAAAFLHGATDRGYLQVWLPASWAHWGDLGVSVGTLLLPVALVCQVREVMTRGTRWRRMDRLLLALGAAPLLCLPSIPLGRYSDWAWVGIVTPWIIAALWGVVAWGNLWRQGRSLPNLLMAGPSVVIIGLGLHVAAVYLGWARLPEMEVALLWQYATLLTSILATLSVGAGLVEKYRASARQQADLIERLHRSELALEERVAQRTTELLKTQNRLQRTLDEERRAREEQRRFFGMVNHEFRTPLAVIDSAAAEQAAYPSAELAPQTARAAQVRRACRRLTTLVDNLLTSDRLDAGTIQAHMDTTPVAALVEDAAQIARWSRRHTALLDLDDAPAEWVCDAMLVRIALSNLVDNAVKHGAPGPVRISARLDERGWLQLSVCDPGPGPAPEATAQIFEAGYRANLRSRGFGLGLWVVRRVCELHQGQVSYARGTDGACFTLALPPQEAAASPPGAGTEHAEA